MQQERHNTWKGLPSRAGEIVEYEGETWICWVPDEITRPSLNDNVWFMVSKFNKETGVVYLKGFDKYYRYTPSCVGGKCIMFPDKHGIVVDSNKFYEVENERDTLKDKLERVIYQIKTITGE